MVNVKEATYTQRDITVVIFDAKRYHISHLRHTGISQKSLHYRQSSHKSVINIEEAIYDTEGYYNRHFQHKEVSQKSLTTHGDIAEVVLQVGNVGVAPGSVHGPPGVAAVVVVH